MWFPGAVAPAHLTGEYAGDRGFDPFGLATDPVNFAKFRVQVSTQLGVGQLVGGPRPHWGPSSLHLPNPFAPLWFLVLPGPATGPTRQAAALRILPPAL